MLVSGYITLLYMYIGCAVLLCLVCLTLLASFFLLISHYNYTQYHHFGKKCQDIL